MSKLKFNIGDTVRCVLTVKPKELDGVFCVTDVRYESNEIKINKKWYDLYFFEMVYPKEVTFKVGDKVMSPTYGKGIVKLTDNDDIEFPMSAFFIVGNTHNFIFYTADGRSQGADYCIDLFHADGYIPPKGGKEPKRYPDLKVDQKVIVWDDGREYDKEKRHFSHFNEYGVLCTFVNGNTSWTSDEGCEDGVPWDNYEVCDEENL